MLLPFKLALRIAALLLAIVLGYFVVTGVQVFMTSRQHSDKDASAIMVLGSAQYDGQPSPDLASRLSEALSLYRAGRAPLVAVTGGRMAGDHFSEAEVSASWLAGRGVPRSRIILGSGSDTYENVASVSPPLKARGASSVLVVTDPFHEARSMAIVSTFGFSPLASPTTSSPITGWATLPFFLKETLAVGAGRIVGYGTLSSASHPGS